MGPRTATAGLPDLIFRGVDRISEGFGNFHFSQIFQKSKIPYPHKWRLVVWPTLSRGTELRLCSGPQGCKAEVYRVAGRQCGGIWGCGRVGPW